MNGQELKEFIELFPSLKNHFKGIFFIDKLPRFLKNYSFPICNTATSLEEGKHWIVFCKINQIVECFDSLGINEDRQNLLKTYCKFYNVKEIIFNETSYQPSNSFSCGKFALYFILERFFNLDLDFEELLSESFMFNHDLNEKIITEFYLDHIKGNV